MSGKKKRISTDGGESLTQNPFGALDGLSGLPAGPEDPPKVESSAASAGGPEKTSKRGQKNTNRGRVDIVRETAHRGGKAVTVVTNFPRIGLPEKKELAKKMQKACSVGGTVKEGRIEIQGDKREEVKRILIEAGFKPVFAGG
jgi:translation initiation factor 1